MKKEMQHMTATVAELKANKSLYVHGLHPICRGLVLEYFVSSCEKWHTASHIYVSAHQRALRHACEALISPSCAVPAAVSAPSDLCGVCVVCGVRVISMHHCECVICMHCVRVSFALRACIVPVIECICQLPGRCCCTKGYDESMRSSWKLLLPS